MMYSSRTLPSAGEKRPADKQQSFIQRFYLFGNSANSSPTNFSSNSNSTSTDSPGTPDRSQPVKKAKKKSSEDSEKEDSPPYSVQRLKQFWNNRLSLTANQAQPSETALARKLKSVTLSSASPSRKPATPEFLRRNGSTRGSATRRNIVRNSLIPLYSNLGAKKGASPKPKRASRESENNIAATPKTESENPKRSSLVLSPVKDQTKEKRSCVERVGYNAGFPLVTATATGGHINWARRVELFGIKPLNGSQEEQPKMPMKVESYVSNYINVDIQNEPSTPEEPAQKAVTSDEKVVSAPHRLEPRDSLDSKRSSSSADTLSLGRRHGTPTRKVSFRTTTSPFNRKLLNPSGNKVAALTNKFNKLIQQDAAILEEVRKRGGYLHKSGGHVYKVIDGDGNGSLRKKMVTTASGKSEETTEEFSTGGKGSYRKPGIKKRPSLRKNLYRTPECDTNRSSLCVKEALEIFEPNHHQHLIAKVDKKPPAGKAKPKVPDKSDQVMQKTKELKCKKSVQIDAKSCDSRKVENVVLSEVPNSISEISSISSENKTEETGNTQIDAANDVCEVDGALQSVEKPTHRTTEKSDSSEPIQTTEKVPEYSVVMKKADNIKEATATVLQQPNTTTEQDVSSPKTNESDKLLTRGEEPKAVKSKSTVQKIYEKFTFRSTKKINLSRPIRTSSESQLSNTVQSEDRASLPAANCLTRKSFISSIEIPTIHIEEPQEDLSDQKIVDAIRSLNQKIDNLSRSFNDLSLEDPEQESTVQPAMQPNNSFLFRSMTKIGHGKETAVSQLNIVQAVNTVLINKSVSMDDHHFPCRSNLDSLYLKQTTPEVTVSKPPTPIENDYELVSKVESPKKVETGSTRGSTMSIDIMELTAKIDSFVHKAKFSENSYQSVLTNPHETNALKNTKDIDSHSVNSYESFENYESIERSSTHPSKEEDTYEICNPPQPLPPRNDSLTLPQPKRNLAGSPNCLPLNLPSYEKINYDKTPPRPPKPEEVPLPPRNPIPMDLTTNREPSISPALSEEPIYEENIYDTIRNCDGVDYDDPNGSGEAVIKRPKASLPPDAISIVSSNCYESIGPKLTMDFLRGSILTLASDQITNSIYGCQTETQSVTPPSERGSDSSNSAEWTDISDDEDDDGSDSRRNNFIIVRKRNKPHQMPVWSRKVRHKLESQQQQQEQLLQHLQSNRPKLDDDSDHVYESLDSHGQSRQSTPSMNSGTVKHSRRIPPPPPAQICVNGEPLPPIGAGWSSTNYAHHPRPSPDDNFLSNEDDFDSFDSDNESDEDHHRKNDSGVDISNVKLPDPPAPNGQVYALMQKIKSLGTLSKSEIAKGLNKLSKKRTSSSKVPKVFTGEGQTSPTAVDESTNYENTPLPKVPKAKSKSFKLPLPLSGAKSSEDYENTDFHSPLSPSSPSPNSSAIASSPASEQADKSLLASISNSDSSNVSTFRKKCKSGKSLRSKLRKSLQSESSLNIGSSFNGSRSTFYVTDSLDVDSGIFNGSEPSSSNLPVSTSGEKEPTVYSAIKVSNHKTPDADRRKSTNSSPASRPTIPPPPPPANAVSGDKKFLKNRKLGATSWYAECGVFKSESLKQNLLDCELKNKERSTTFWYTEAGLYQTSAVSDVSSSGSSGVSTGGEGGPGDDHSHSMFVNEPLYQIYNAAKLESLTRDIDAEITGHTELYDDGYEKISNHSKDGEHNGFADEESGRKLRPSAFELIEPDVGKLRTLWCEIPEVINSQILLTLTPNEKRLQEAKFEILTSEASYLKSLHLLRSHFINHPAFREVKVLTSSERKTLFSNIIPVHECSDRLLCDLENCWQDNIMLLGLSHSIFKHAEKHFHVYVNYCESQAKIERMLKNLKANKAEFSKSLLELEADPVCCGLSLSSFLMLPMQRITRMRLLLDAVLQRLKCDDDEFESWEKTFVLINRILTQCNDAAHRSEQMHEMETISRNIEFPTHIRPLAVVPCGIGSPGSVMRKLEKRGELIHLLWRGDDAKLTFGKKFSKSNIYAFLFTDLLVLTKKKSDETYLVTDYCPRALLTVNSGDVVPQLPTKEMQAIGKHLIIMTLLENHEGKTVEMILSCPSETERERWLKVTEPLASENPDEKIYEQWDCPQVIAVHPYQALQPDELGLDIKDVVNVHRKMADGWYEGERIRDGAVGWFPGNYTKEIFSAHIRAKHIKQRHMLLSYTSKYIDTTTMKLPKK